MIVTNFYLVGNVTLPSSWLALISAFIVAYVAVRLRFGKEISGVLIDAIFYFVLVWKLSVIVTDFGNVIKSPLSIIYFNGGTIGFYLALLAVGITLIVESKKKQLHKVDRIALFMGFIVIQSTYQIMMALLNDVSTITMVGTIFIFVSFVIIMWISIEKWRIYPLQLIILFAVVHIFIASLQPLGILAGSVLTTILFSLFFSLYLTKEYKNESEDIL